MSAHERRDDPLPEQADALLEGWPAPSRSALEWEDLANATMARIRETSVGSTPDDLLAPPLPREEHEGESAPESARETSDPADEPGLLAIAKAAVADGAGSDVKDIARAGLLAAKSSRQSRPPAPAVRGGSAASRAAGLQGEMPASRRGAVQAVHEAEARSELPAARKPASDKVGTGTIITGAVLALAAGVALYVGVRRHDSSAVATTTQESAPAAPAHAAAGSAAQAAPPAVEPADQKQATLTLDELKPSAGEAAKVVMPSASAPMSLALRRGAASSGGKKSAAPAEVANAAPGGPQQQGVILKESDEAAAAPSPRQQAVATDDQTQALPSRPSVGAIQGAIGSVMLGARSCLAGQDSGSKATVTFGADGHVKNVGVSGPAAGTPAESCVRSALMGARVPPFSDPEYSASFTVRPP